LFNTFTCHHTCDAYLTDVLKNYTSSIVSTLNNIGDKKIYSFFFVKRYDNSCGGHPDYKEYEQIAAELTGDIRKLKHWQTTTQSKIC
jgi:hypothetical protein